MTSTPGRTTPARRATVATGPSPPATPATRVTTRRAPFPASSSSRTTDATYRLRKLLRAAAREAGARRRPRSLALRLALRRRLVRRRLRHDWLVGPEDVLLGPALEQADELVALDGLAAQQDVRRVVEFL